MKNNNSMHSSDIDFIILWVDSNDIEWQKKKDSFTPEKTTDFSLSRYRDWNNLRYWFRAIAKYAPWVRIIHFVTDGQIPNWLNMDNPHLRHVNHKDFIPKQFLPVFNSNAIEIGMNHIPELADKFVLFNDDMFLLKPIKPDYYFKNGYPVDMAGLTRVCSPKDGSVFGNIMLNNYKIINMHYDKKHVLKHARAKWIKLSYGKAFIRTLLNNNRNQFDGIVIPHLSVPYFKSDIERVWNLHEDLFIKTQQNRFRDKTDLSHYIFRFWRLCEGDFYARRSKGMYLALRGMDDIKKAIKIIKNKKKFEVCLNDVWQTDDIEYAKNMLNEAFDNVLHEKCEYEI